jgi:hypothetical protein
LATCVARASSSSTRESSTSSASPLYFRSTKWHSTQFEQEWLRLEVAHCCRDASIGLCFCDRCIFYFLSKLFFVNFTHHP